MVKVTTSSTLRVVVSIHKIWMEDTSNSRSVHAFVDMKTGEVYKPASVKAPAKGVRFNLLIIKEREDMLENC